ncbi:hypothetical protein DFH06DRAFT_1190390 [Mycena polygramma]|nr:hypothetical protein DFH06DRAFT_1190390 [Mycena polygramma]
MTDACNPLLVQELLDQCISFLREFPSDLKTCALVSRLWVNGAQALLFQKIFIGSSDTWLKLQGTLQISPHLTRHIQSLIVRAILFSDDAFSAVCNFAFTNLRQLYVYGMSPSHPPPSILPLQELLSRPTLSHIILHFETAITRSFFPLWERCSRSLRHLELYSSPGSPSHYLSRTDRSLPPIPLESLRIMTMGRVGDIGDWLSNPLGPFDLSNLRVLSIVNCPEDLWRALPPIFRSITALELTAQESGAPFDLSTLPNLEILRIESFSAAATRMVVNSLSTANHIRRLLLTMESYVLSADCGQLDARLADVLTDPPPTVELQMDAGQYEEYVLYFPRLSARNLMRRFEPTRSWFSDYAGVSVPL